jgi:hypothetical protein
MMTNPREEEPCPYCGELYRVRWIDSDAQSDTWECIECDHMWEIAVTVSTQPWTPVRDALATNAYWVMTGDLS